MKSPPRSRRRHVDPRNEPIQAVLFDLGGTLVDNRDYPAFEDMANRAGISVDADTIAHWTSAMRDENDRQGETWTLEEFWRKVIEGAAGAPVPEAHWKQFYRAAEAHEPPAHLYSDVRMCLDELKDNHLRLGVLTNHISEQSARQILAKEGVLGFFEVVVASGTERVAKPDPRFFQRGLDRLKVIAGETLYVGDKPNTDVPGRGARGTPRTLAPPRRDRLRRRPSRDHIAHRGTDLDHPVRSLGPRLHPGAAQPRRRPGRRASTAAA